MAPLLAHDSAVACLAVLQNHSLQQISSSPSSQTISLQSTAVLTLGLLSNPHAPAPCHSFVLEDFSVWFSELLHLKICSQMHPLGELSQCPPTPCPPTLQLSCPPQYFFFVFIFCQSNLYMSLHCSLSFYIVQDSLPFLNLSESFISHVREVNEYNFFKYFSGSFNIFLLQNPNVDAFDVVPDTPETLLISFHSLFCSVAVISNILSSSSLICSSASVILLLISTGIIFISVAVSFNSFFLILFYF